MLLKSLPFISVAPFVIVLLQPRRYLSLFTGLMSESPFGPIIDKHQHMKEKKEPTDDISKDVYSLLAQHVSGIIMPIVRRQTE